MLHVEQTADRCIKCNICNTVCPVSAVTDLFPGPKYEGRRASGSGPASRTGVARPPLDYCSACGLCTRPAPRA